MSTMVCSICGKYGIYWKNLCGLSGLSPYTFCPHCRNTNCQQPEPQPEEGEEGEADND